MSRRIAPERRCIPPAEWPIQDRLAWERALSPGSALDEPGRAAHWRASSRRKVASAYGRWLGWLQRAGLCDPLATPMARPRPRSGDVWSI
jgi:hypothetical protein